MKRERYPDITSDDRIAFLNGITGEYEDYCIKVRCDQCEKCLIERRGRRCLYGVPYEDVTHLQA